MDKVLREVPTEVKDCVKFFQESEDYSPSELRNYVFRILEAAHSGLTKRSQKANERYIRASEELKESEACEREIHELLNIKPQIKEGAKRDY